MMAKFSVSNAKNKGPEDGRTSRERNRVPMTKHRFNFSLNIKAKRRQVGVAVRYMVAVVVVVMGPCR